MKKIFKNKKILITAGSTWVSIDAVRVVTNIFSGKLGIIIAKTAYDMGAKVTLLLGSGGVDIGKKLKKNIRIIHFKYFEELLKLLKKEVSSKSYDIIIHSAAVSDYVPICVEEGKIKSRKNNLVIKFKPTIKIIDRIKKWDPSVFLVKFKLEVGLKKKQLIDRAYKSMLESKADLIVANDFRDIIKEHKAFIINNNMNIIECKGKNKIAKKLLYLIKKSI